MMVTCAVLMAEMEALGTEQNRKIYRRHGAASPEVFGLSYAHLGKLQKKVRVDHELAKQLWATGNHDARVLAARIADPKQTDRALLDQWVHDLGDYILTDAFSEHAGKTALAAEMMAQWIESDEEWIGSTGWNVLGLLALKDNSLPDSFFEPYLALIERDLHHAKNRVRYAMNNALIAIGGRSESLKSQAMQAARHIGVVTVDHGETGCKTPDATSYIEKMWARKKA
ncbi:MAG: DNA alkylation repair protein [Anaerolineae bacterium]|nr:DNA alkylation repair protein [Anaerolineae bacterium]